MRCLIGAAALVPIAALPAAAFAQGQADLVNASQNPVAAMISLPFPHNTFSGVGPDDDVANVLDIQPAVAIKLGPGNLAIARFPPDRPARPHLGRGGAAGRGPGRIDLWPRRHQRHGLAVARESGEVAWGIGLLDQLSERDRQEAWHAEVERRGSAVVGRSPGRS